MRQGMDYHAYSLFPLPLSSRVLDVFLRDPLVQQLAGLAVRDKRVVCRGSVGASSTYLTAALHTLTGRTLVLVLAHTDDADCAYDELRSLNIPAQRFPALEVLPGESGISLDALAERLGAVRVLERWRQPDAPGGVLVAPIAALMQAVPALTSLDSLQRVLRAGEELKSGPAGLARWLDSAGYTRVPTVEEPGHFAVRGGIVDIFPPGDAGASSAQDSPDASLGGVPVRVDFLGDTIDKLHEIDLASMGVDRQIHSVQLVCARADLIQSDKNTVQLASLLPAGSIVLLSELLEITEQGRGYFERVHESAGIFGPPAVLAALGKNAGCTIEAGTLGIAPGGAIDLPVRPVPALSQDIAQAVGEVGELALLTAGQTIITCTSQGELDRLGELITQFAPRAAGRITGVLRYVHQGFTWEAGQVNGQPLTHLLLPYAELLHRFTARRHGRGPRLRAGRAMDTFLELQVGDYAVHQEHGIARFTGLVWLQPRDVKRTIDDRLTGLTPTAQSQEEPLEHLVLEFAGGAKLYVPATKIDLVNKYIGGFRGKPPLSTLGGERWKNQKNRVGQSVRELAAELLRVRAARAQLPGITYPADTDWQRRFEDEFAYQETDDQLAAMAEIKRDMTSPRPMDRLLCGDVGFGKTELAIRAAFKAAEAGKQVAVLVPTTVLAEQHERTFKGRLADYPFGVQSISRFKTGAEETQILAELAQGKVDIIIGTHRLLSKDVRFADLGVVIIDEEQRFGVEHKERLLALRLTADILTLSATPIPRTLHMSMLGLRDISSLTTPPLDRRAVVTEVIPKNPTRLTQIIARELARQGQVFYVHNRVHDILSVADDVQRLAPGARIAVGHGQMGDAELERVILSFVRGEADILVCTTIIESGIDIPRANTIIIEDADRFGLADLHQLRGRVGRSKHRGYCYLLLPEGRPLKDHAKARLKALEEFSMLGAGFKIAMRDLEIRGAGNILGPEQSGHIAAVGYDMYCRLLDRAVKDLRQEQTESPSQTTIDIGISGWIPRTYIPSDLRRLEAYRRLALCGNEEELAKVHQDLAGAYGSIPDPAARLLDLAALRIAGRNLGVKGIAVRDRDVLFRTTNAAATTAALQGAPIGATGWKVTTLPPKEPGQTAEVYLRPDNPAGLEPQTLLAVLRRRLGTQGTTAPTPTAIPTPSIKKPVLPKGGPPAMSASLKALRKDLRRR